MGTLSLQTQEECMTNLEVYGFVKIVPKTQKIRGLSNSNIHSQHDKAILRQYLVDLPTVSLFFKPASA